MTRRKTKPEEIQNPDHYFRKYIAMEIKHDQADEKEYHRMFLSTDAILENSVDGISRERLLSLALNIKGELYESITTPNNSQEWITQMQNRTLRKAMNELSHKQQDVLFYRYYQEDNQEVTAELMDISQQSVSRLERRAKEKIEKIFAKGCKKS